MNILNSIEDTSEIKSDIHEADYGFVTDEGNWQSLCTSEEPVSNKYVEHVSDHEWSLISVPNIRPDFDDNSISLEI